MIMRYKTAAPIPELIRLYEQRLLQCEQSPQQPLPDLAFFRQCRNSCDSCSCDEDKKGPI